MERPGPYASPPRLEVRGVTWNAGLGGVVAKQAPDFERQVHRQPCFGIGEVEAADLPDTVHPVEQRVPVNVQLFGRLAQIPIFLEEGFKRFDKLVVNVAFAHQITERFSVETA